MDEKIFVVFVEYWTIESARSAAQEFFEGVQEDKYNGIFFRNDSEENLAEIMHIFLEMCLQMSSKIVFIKLEKAAFGNMNNSILFQEILASPQSVLHTLTFGNLGSTTTVEQAQHVHDGLACNKSIQILDIGCPQKFINVDLRTSLLSALAKRESCLKELRVSSPCNGIIGTPLSQVIEGGKCPQKLYLNDVQDEEFIQVLADYISSHNCLLTSLNMGCRDVPNFDVLCNAIQVNQSLTSLSFNCLVSSHAVQSLVARVGSHTNLTSLQLATNNWNDEFIEEFCSHWPQDSHLESLDFQCNCVGPIGAARLVDAIANHPTIKTLDLSWNYTLGFEGLTVIGKALPKLQLTSINLNNCTEFYNGYARVAGDNAGQALLEGIHANSFLQEVNVSGNCFDGALCKKIDFWVSLNQKIGTVLSAEQQELPVAIWCNFLGKLSCSPIWVYTMLQQQPHVLM